MISIREQYLSDRFNEWLDRFSPPRRIANDPAAQQKDVDAMLATVLRNAPREEYGEWFADMIRRLEEGMTTRSWPAPGELTKACRSGRVAASKGDDEVTEAHAVQALTTWFRKFRTQMPSMGNPARTAALIKDGVLANEREAKFYGFDLNEGQMRRAGEQRMGRAEWDHHLRVCARLRGVSESEAAHQERNRERSEAPESVRVPDKRADTRNVPGWENAA